MSVLNCPVTESEILNWPDFADCTKDLASGPDQSIPFMISYDLYLMHDQAFCQPDCRAWIENSGRIFSLPLGAVHPGLSRKIAPQCFSLLAFSDLRDKCKDRLLGMNSDPQGGTYHLCASPHGVILAADWISSRNSFAGLMPAGLSNHQAAACLAGLQTCANAILANKTKNYSDVQVTRRKI